MGKNIRLADIYIKIYNKQPLMMDDLVFLAKYDRECFEKTCRNLLYNIPEVEGIMQPKGTPPEEIADVPDGQQEAGQSEAVSQAEGPSILALMENLKKMEWEELKVQDLDAGNVKNLLGSLYMEMMFPHNDRYRYFQLEDAAESSIFNKKA